MDEQPTGAIAVTEAQWTAVTQRLQQTELSRRERERLEMVKAAALGADIAAITRWSGRTARTVQRWLGRFLAGGMAALRDAPRPGRPAKADAAYRAALEATVTTPPPDLGLPVDVWTSARLSAYLAETTGVRIAPGWIRALLAQADFACGRPKHTLGHLQDPDEVATCEQELAAAGKKNGGRTGPV